MSDPTPSVDLDQFERELNPLTFSAADANAQVLGYGEISTVFQIGADREQAYKRMPLFTDISAANEYAGNYRQYCDYLRQAGIELPPDELKSVVVPGRPVALYIIQKQYPAAWFAHHLIHSESESRIKPMLQRIGDHINRIWEFNHSRQPHLEIALDGQLSNWLFVDGNVETGKLLYVDTSTPLFRLDGEEQLDPELFLKSAPGFLRWIIRWLFLDDVMNRYYDRRQVMIDLVANLHKEQRSDLVPPAREVVTPFFQAEDAAIEEEEIRKYYTEDKLIWTLFLSFRRIDRWIKTRILRQHYDFLLPGKIKR